MSDTREQWKALVEQRQRAAAKPHKYGAKAKIVDGIRFASTKEAKRYQDLKLLEKAEKIGGLLLQPVFDLIVHDISVGARLKRAAARLGNKPEPRLCKKIGQYRADFSYWEPPISSSEQSVQIVEDVKGFKTALYRWKKKHVEAQYGIQIREI